MPDWTRDIGRALAPLSLRPEREREIADELAAHLEDRFCEAKGRGATDDAARAEALTELGAVLVPELRRVESPWQPAAPLGNPQRLRMLETLLHDARSALRSLRRTPGFTSVSLFTLALGIGACTLILSAVNAVLVRPLPFREPSRLAVFWGTAPEKGLPEVDIPEGMAAVYQSRTRTLETFAAYGGIGFNLTGNGDAERVAGAQVSVDFFKTLGATPLLGRLPVLGEDQPNAPSTVIVLSHALWMRRFGGDTSIVGRKIDLNGSPVTVIGVMRPRFDFPYRSEAWIPWEFDATKFNCWCFSTIGRMRPGVTTEDVRAEMATITDDFGLVRRDVFPTARRGGSRVVAMTLSERLVGGIEKQLFTLLAAVGCVLLIACANIANLLLARTAARGRELAVRCCLGASPRRIASQLLTESVLLSLGGATLGALFAAWGTSALRRLPSAQFPRIDEVRVDLVVLAATVAVALITGLLCGLIPAWRATRVDLQDAMKDGAKGSSGRGSRRASNGFIVAQFALSLLLLVGAGLLLRSYHRLSRLDAGYRPDNALVARLSLPYPRYSDPNVVRDFYTRLLEQVRAIPSVNAAGMATYVPLSPGNNQDGIEAEGKESTTGEGKVVANIRLVHGDYFAAMGTPLLQGRLFSASDDARAPRVAVVDELFAKHFWPGEDPLGKRFRHGGDTTSRRWVTVIGVVRNVKHSRLDEAGDLQVYEYFVQRPTWGNFVVLRLAPASDDASVVSAVRYALRSIDPSVPLFDVRTMRQAVDDSLGVRRLMNTLLVGFSVTALLLAAIGIYGVMSLGVSGRVREFGIRLALGAKPGAVRGLVLRQAAWLALSGIVAGFIAAVATTRYLRALLFNVESLDAVTFIGVALLLAVTAFAASYLPARRATRADPMAALRSE